MYAWPLLSRHTHERREREREERREELAMSMLNPRLAGAGCSDASALCWTIIILPP